MEPRQKKTKKQNNGKKSVANTVSETITFMKTM